MKKYSILSYDEIQLKKKIALNIFRKRGEILISSKKY